jgi:hypothetical protein
MGQSVELVLEDPDVLGAQRGVKVRKQRVTEKVEEKLGVKVVEFRKLQIDWLHYSDPPNGRAYKCFICQDVCTFCGMSTNGHHTK